ncbi:UNVERIFIED_CONTAM: pimeloyl-ACP methyl ester carboxylesterase [Acetivibrio alkalicellulosi]
MEITKYHPFKSEKARNQYLKLYDNIAKKWPVDSEIKKVRTSYGETYIRVSGQYNTQTLVLLPGLGTNSLLWMPCIKDLSEKYKTYSIDYIYDKNCGRSVYSKSLKNVDDYMKWLDQLFDSIEVENKFNLMGTSLGSWLASKYTLRNPKILNKVVLLAPGSNILPMKLEYILRMLLCVIPHKYFFKSNFYWLFKDSRENDTVTLEILKNMVDEMYLALKCFNSKVSIFPTKLRDDELKSISVPLLFLIGENEKQCSAIKCIQRLNRIAPYIKTELIPNAGHDILMAQPELVTNKILEFLK